MDHPRSWRTQGIDLTVEPVLRIGGATIDPVSRDATFPGGHERLQPQNLKVLIALVRRKGEVVTRAELIDLCWDGRIVGEDVINHSISVLRAFAARVRDFTIETVPKAGYRLTDSDRAAAGRGKWIPAFAVAVIATLAGALLFVTVPADKQGQPPAPTVAIMAFAAEAKDPAAAQLGRATRASLSHMLADSGFPVRLTEAGDMDSDFLISGDIEHGSGNFSAMVRLEETRNKIVVFTRRFEVAEAEAASLPEQIGAYVAANLSWTGGMMILDRRNPTDPRITGELLRQMSMIVADGDPLRAYQIARDIAPKAPNSAIAQLALAFNTAFALGQLPREQRESAVAAARRAAERGRVLAPEFGDTHIPWCILHSPVRIAECEARLREGMRVDPAAPFAGAFLSSLLYDTGRFEEALELARMSVANDPYMPSKLARVVHALDLAGHRREASLAYARALRWWPEDGRIFWGRVSGFVELGDLAAIERLASKEPALLETARELIAAMRSRDGGRAVRTCGREGQHPAAPMLCLVILAELGRNDAAFATADAMFPRMQGRNRLEEERLWLDNPYGYSPGILSAPSARSLRRDPRYLDVVRRIGLLDYWRTGKLPDFCRHDSEPVCARITG